MITISPEAKVIIQEQVDLMLKEDERLFTRLIPSFWSYHTERGSYTELMNRLSGGEDHSVVLQDYGTIRPDYSTLHFGVGGYEEPSKVKEHNLDIEGYEITFDTTAHKLLDGRSLVVGSRKFTLIAEPMLSEELIREIYEKQTQQVAASDR